MRGRKKGKGSLVTQRERVVLTSEDRGVASNGGFVAVVCEANVSRGSSTRGLRKKLKVTRAAAWGWQGSCGTGGGGGGAVVYRGCECEVVASWGKMRERCARGASYLRFRSFQGLTRPVQESDVHFSFIKIHFIYIN